MSTKTDRNLIIPFSPDFAITWQLWKDFRKEEHNFQYKSVISEQMALKRLTEVSEGMEDKAVRIVEQSISRGWMDFYQLKQPSNNGKSGKQKQGNTGTDTTGKVVNLKSGVQDAVNNRYGGGGQNAGSNHTKAV